MSGVFGEYLFKGPAKQQFRQRIMFSSRQGQWALTPRSFVHKLRLADIPVNSQRRLERVQKILNIGCAAGRA